MTTDVPITGTIRATPQNPTLGKVASALRSLQELAGQYQVLPQVPLLGGTSVDELLGLPGAAREVESWSYGDYPVRINPNAGRTASYIPEVKPGRKSDLADTLLLGMDVAPLAGAVVKNVGRGVNRAANLAGDKMVQAITRNPQATSVGVLQEAAQMSPLAAVVKPQGNINLRPVLSAEALRGPDVQPVEAFLSQAKGTPGVTQDAFKELAARYEDIAPGTKLSKADFEARIPPSEYSVIDLHTGNVESGFTDDVLEQARDAVRDDPWMVFDEVLARLGLTGGRTARYDRAELGQLLQEYHSGGIGFDELPSTLRSALRRAGMHDADEGIHLLDNLVHEEMDRAVAATAENMMEYADEFVGASGYKYQDVQRLLSSDTRAYLDENNYFELGVTHPQRESVYYKHYTGYEPVDDGIVGHIRGTRIPKDFENPMVLAPGVGSQRQQLKVKPNSVVIEEIQSDAQKGAMSAEQTGALRQVHGTLFKAAVDDALSKGATTVYYPTARTIAMVRGNDPAPYASIYDQQIMREGLKPLSRIPGVEIKPIQLMGSSSSNKAPAPYTAYYEINFSPEAKDYILNGPGQTTPGYGKGGVVKSLAEAVEKYLGREAAQTAAAAAVKEAPKEQRMLQGFYRGYAGDYDADKAAADAGMVFVAPQRAAAEFYAKKRARQMGEDPHLEMILADPFAGYIYGHNIPLGPDNRKVDFTKARQLQPEHVKGRTKLYAAGGAVNFDPDEIAQMAGEFTDQFTPGYAAGGLVKYDPNEIDTIVSKMKEAFHG